MFSPQVTLPSGGYIVINPTEALVSIDVNSGRATKEHNIEDTALQTNLEAAEEISRQLRLRDLAGLIVIDFIDMMENRSNRAVERKLKDCLKNDRARIQVGRISHFGLMEMSRQRIRFGAIESSTHKCPTCQGTGLVRSVESLALMVMRQIEEHVLRKPGFSINVRVPTDVALYMLNTKRVTLSVLEEKHNLSVTLVADDHVGPAHFAIERGEPRIAEYREQRTGTHVRVDTAAIEDVAVEDEPEEAEEVEETEERQARGDEGERGGRRRRRRRGRGERGEERAPARPTEQLEAEEAGEAAEEEGEETAVAAEGGAREDSESRRRRRRGRRGGRRNRRPGEEGVERIEANGDASAAAVSDEAITEEEAREAAAEVTASEFVVAPATPEQLHGRAVGDEEPVAEAPAKPKRARRTRKSADADATVQDAPAEAVEKPAPKPRRSRKPKAEAAAEPAPAIEVAAPAAVPVETASSAAEDTPRRPKKELPPDEIVVSSTAPGEEQPKKKGWWNRGFFG
jgi:ribonuclease E